jgi:hypothetical protein
VRKRLGLTPNRVRNWRASVHRSSPHRRSSSHAARLRAGQAAIRSRTRETAAIASVPRRGDLPDAASSSAARAATIPVCARSSIAASMSQTSAGKSGWQMRRRQHRRADEGKPPALQRLLNQRRIDVDDGVGEARQPHRGARCGTVQVQRCAVHRDSGRSGRRRW